MGHIRLGVLPATRPWVRVVELLGDTGAEVTDIAVVTANAAIRLFGKGTSPGLLTSEPGLLAAYWVLSQVVFLSPQSRYFDQLRDVGIEVDSASAGSCVSFISDVARAAESQAESDFNQSAFSELALLSLKETLARALTNQTNTLFGTTAEDIRSACRRYATTKRFGMLSKDFFATFLYRTMNFLLSKAIHDHVGPGRRFNSLSELSDFESALRTYCHERARIVESFAGGWTSKENYERGVTPEAVQRFMAIAVKKIGKELSVQGIAVPGDDAV